jgi:hypothetical protein
LDVFSSSFFYFITKQGIALKSLQYIDYALVEQVRGIAYLHNLFEVISSKEEG